MNQPQKEAFWTQKIISQRSFYSVPLNHVSDTISSPRPLPRYSSKFLLCSVAPSGGLGVQSCDCPWIATYQPAILPWHPASSCTLSPTCHSVPRRAAYRAFLQPSPCTPAPAGSWTTGALNEVGAGETPSHRPSLSPLASPSSQEMKYQLTQPQNTVALNSRSCSYPKKDEWI